MSRLLFAAARGARIQTWGSTIRKWFEVTDMHLIDEADGDRIHPDDAHLQYGPLSTALRKFAEIGLTNDPLVIAIMDEHIYEACSFVKVEPAKLASLALLLAEQAADEGM